MINEEKFEKEEDYFHILLESNELELKKFMELCEYAIEFPNILKGLEQQQRLKFVNFDKSIKDGGRFLDTLAECFCSYFEAVDSEDDEIMVEELKQIEQMIKIYKKNQHSDEHYQSLWELQYNKNGQRNKEVQLRLLALKSYIQSKQLKQQKEEWEAWTIKEKLQQIRKNKTKTALSSKTRKIDAQINSRKFLLSHAFNL